MELTEKYEQTKSGDWIYYLYENEREITNSLNIPPFSQKEDAEQSAFGWMIQNGYV